MRWNELKEKTDNYGFVEEYEIYRRTKPNVTLIVIRTVTDPTLFRNSDSGMAEIQEFNGNQHAQINSEKLVSKERLTGLSLCRRLDVNQNIIHAAYTYNEPLASIEDSQNADFLTYGLAGTVSNNTFSQKSRVIEGYTYSLEPYNLMIRETHNAIYESGTMTNEKNKQSQALYNVVKVQPNTHLIHFITIESATKEMLLYVMYNLMNTGSYGARESRTGHNIRNEVVGVITSLSNSNLSCGEFIYEFGTEFKDGNYSRENILNVIKDYVNKYKRADWRIYYRSNSDFVEAATPEAATPEAATPEAATPEAATPEAATPEAATPEVATPGTTTSKPVLWLNEMLNVANDKVESSSQILAEALQIMRSQGLHTVVKHDLDGKNVEISQTAGGGKGKVVRVHYYGKVTVDIDGTRKVFNKNDLKVIENENEDRKRSRDKKPEAKGEDKNQSLVDYT